MKVQSGKAKGRRLQQWVRDLLVESLDIHPEDIESRSMGAGGEDLIMSRAARQSFPYSIECKNQEKLNIWAAWDQCKGNAQMYQPLCLIKKNGVTPLVVLEADVFLDYVKEFNDDR